MNKIYFYLIGLCFFIFPCCSSPLTINPEEEFFISLPQWPPEDSQKSDYPELSRWKIIITSTEETKCFFTTDSSFSFTFQKNLPYAIIFQPITLLENGKETEYFYPAGIIYPYSQTNSKTINASWEEGFLAYTIYRIISSRKETGVSQKHLENFLKEFNWKKVQENINSKIENSSTEEKSPCFNPWLIDSEKLLDNLCYGNFKASFLNPTGIFIFNLETLFSEDDFFPLSSFIPENKVIVEKNKIALRKNYINFLSDGKKSGVVLQCKSAKNVSKEYIQMPIYIEDI